MSQCEQVLEYMKNRGSITTLDAFHDLGVTRLGSRIYDLRQSGHRIKGEQITVLNRYGEKVHCFRYSLED